MSDLANPATSSLPIFSGEKYDYWSTILRTYFKSKGLWEFIEVGCPVCLDETGDVSASSEKEKEGTVKAVVDESKVKKEIENDNAALFVIQTTIAEVIFPLISGAVCAKQAWEILSRKYQGHSKVNESKASNLFLGSQNVTPRFPCAVKTTQLSKSLVTPAKGSLLPGRTSPPIPRMDTPAQTLPEVDSNLSAKLYSALRMLRTVLVEEAGENVMAYHIFGNPTLQQISNRIPRSKDELLEINGIGEEKVSKYGDLLLETIESTIRDYYNGDKTSNSSNDSDVSTIIFEKLLTRADVEKKLSVPTRCLAYFEGLIEGTSALDLKAKDEKGQLMTFCCTTRKKGYKKPVFTKGWREYVRRKKLRVGDKIIFQQLEVAVYKIEAQRRNTILGPKVWCNLSDDA